MRKHGSAALLSEKPIETPKAFAVIDYPQEKEVVVSEQYTFRLGASPEIERIEISINGGDWQPCRQAVGYWWFDWAGYAPSAHRLEARGISIGGETILSETRRFSVKFPKPIAAAKPAAKTPRGRKKLA